MAKLSAVNPLSAGESVTLLSPRPGNGCDWPQIIPPLKGYHAKFDSATSNGLSVYDASEVTIVCRYKNLIIIF